MRKRTLNQLVTPGRWSAYAAAGAAAAVGAGNTAEADIYYSGVVNIDAGDPTPDNPATNGFTPLFTLQGGNNLILTGFHQQSYGIGVAGMLQGNGGASGPYGIGQVAGFNPATFSYVSRLSYGQNVSNRGFLTNTVFPLKTMAFGAGFTYSQFAQPTTNRDFIGFRFDLGNGTQYGWIEVAMQGTPLNRYTILGYAYADPGESISAGQISAIPEAGSMGLLALGGVGLMMWRKRRQTGSAA